METITNLQVDIGYLPFVSINHKFTTKNTGNLMELKPATKTASAGRGSVLEGYKF